VAYGGQLDPPESSHLEFCHHPNNRLWPLRPLRGRNEGRYPEHQPCGHVIHIDRFGNLITDIREQDVSANGVTVEMMGRRMDRLSRTYGEGSGLVALIGSSGYLEIAVNQGSAAQLLGAEIGAPVTVRIGAAAREPGQPARRRR
jgi:hypothetical protein